MKTYMIEYGWASSGPQKSIIFADNETEALTIAKENTTENLEIVTEDPKETKDDSGILECKITEIPQEKGLIYTGHFCC